MEASPNKARVYLYDKNGIVQKVTYVNEDGSESESLSRYFHLGMLQDTVLFGDNGQIRFYLYNGISRGIAPYDSDVDKFEIINNSRYSVFYGSGKERVTVMSGETKTVTWNKGDIEPGDDSEMNME